MLEASDDSSLTSEDLEHLGGGYIDSDTGLESMSSAETAAKSCSVCQERPSSTCSPSSNEALIQEVTRLKCDKLDLLRQNVVRTFVNENQINSNSHTYVRFEIWTIQ